MTDTLASPSMPEVPEGPSQSDIDAYRNRSFAWVEDDHPTAFAPWDRYVTENPDPVDPRNPLAHETRDKPVDYSAGGGTSRPFRSGFALEVENSGAGTDDQWKKFGPEPQPARPNTISLFGSPKAQARLFDVQIRKI